MKKITGFVVLTMAFMLTSCMIISKRAELSRQMKIIHKSQKQQGFIGIDISNLTTGQSVYSHNADLLFTPASTLKLFTTVSALRLYGHDYTFQTKVYTSSKPVSGFVKGNIYLVPSGDPTLASTAMISSIKDPGDFLKTETDTILQISGDLVEIVSFSDDTEHLKGRLIDDLGYAYCAPLSELSFHDNTVSFEFSHANDRFNFNITPDYPNIQLIFQPDVHSENLTDLSLSKCYGINAFVVNGDLTRDFTKTMTMSIDHPETNLSAYLLKEIENAGKFTKFPASDFSPDSLYLFKQISSPSLIKICQIINKQSNNHYADQIYRYLRLSTEIKPMMSQIGIDTTEIVLCDGSGLSVYDKLHPIDFTRLLSNVYHDPSFEQIKETLSIAGMDGTLKNKFKTKTFLGNFYGKSGSMRNTGNIVGYYQTPKGTMYSVVIMGNNLKQRADISQMLSDVCTALDKGD